MGETGPDAQYPAEYWPGGTSVKAAGGAIEFGVRHFLSILFGAVFTSATCWSIGRVSFDRLRIRLRQTEHELLACVTGAAVLSLIVFLLCVAHLVWIPVMWAVGLGALALRWKFSAGMDGAAVERLPRLWRWLAGIIAAFYAFLYLTNSIAPENSPDGQAYHLALVYRYFRLHGFERLTTNMYSNLSQGMEMLYLFAFSFGRHAAAATFHCCFLFALALLMFCYGRRIGRPVTGACAALLVYLSPVVGIDGVSAYNDVALATVGFATFYLVEIWRATKEQVLLVPAGLLAGFCFAIKYTGFVAAAYVFCVVAWELARRRVESRKLLAISLATVTGLVVVMAAPWLLKNWLWLGNPVSPFMNSVFPNPFIHISFEDEYRRYFRSYDLPSLWPVFWMDTVKGQLGGQVGPTFLLAPVALLSLRKPEGRRILLAWLFFFLPCSQNLGARFLIPSLPFLAMGIAMALEFSRPTQTVLVMAAALLAWPKVINKYRAPAGGWQIATMPWKAALGIVPQDKWLQERDGGWTTARMLDEFVPAGKRIWSTTPLAESYSTSEILVSYYSAEGELIQDILTSAFNTNYQPLWNLRYTFPPRTMEHLRLVQNTASETDIWSIGEMKFFLGEREIPRAPSWRFDASAFPWDIGFAFDSNPVTRWRAWEPARRGMHVDVDFGGPVRLDRIELHCSHDQWKIEVNIEGVDAHLKKLEDPPFGDLRRIAMATVKMRGIDYILMGGDHVLAKDIDGDPGRWGLKKIADRGDTWLFQIQ